MVEGVVIVGSILLAFGIEALWSERQERLDELEAIAQLTTDFRANAARLDTIRAVHEQALVANYEILARAGVAGERAGIQSAGELVFLALRAWTYDPVLGGINALIQSGRLGLLRDDALRIAVAGWPDIVEDLNGDELLETSILYEQLAPYLMTKGVMFDVLLEAGTLDQLEPQVRSDLESLFDDPFYLQIVSWRVNGLENVLAEVETVEQSISDILTMLERG